MENEYEIITHNKLKHIHIFFNQIIYRTYHLHNDFELFCVLEGTGKLSTKNYSQDLKTGSLLLLNSNEAHKIDTGSDNVTALILQFSNHFLYDYYPNIRNTVFRQTDIMHALPSAEQKILWGYIRQITEAYIREEDCFELKCVCGLAELLLLLLKFIPYDILNENEYAQHKKRSERMNRVISYLEANYQMPVRLQDVADLEQISPTHFSHFFSEAFGITFQEYLNKIRFEHAARLLGNGTLSLSDVAASSGFSELKYMTKMFEKTLNCKPAAFRNRIFAVSDNENVCKTSDEIIEYRYTKEESIRLLNMMKDLY